MLDLLVSLAAKSKLNPTGLALILVSEDTGKALSYKPNQIIGALGGRVVRIVNKDVVSARSTRRDSKHERPFEVMSTTGLLVCNMSCISHLHFMTS